jgi:hypothetical protein
MKGSPGPNRSGTRMMTSLATSASVAGAGHRWSASPAPYLRALGEYLEPLSNPSGKLSTD